MVAGLVGWGTSACAVIDVSASGSCQRYFVLGVAYIALPVSEREHAGFVVNSRSLGLLVTAAPRARVSLGYASELTVVVPTDRKDVLVEVSGDSEKQVSFVRMANAKRSANEQDRIHDVCRDGRSRDDRVPD